jgi:chromosome segregation ATPase
MPFEHAEVTDKVIKHIAHIALPLIAYLVLVGFGLELSWLVLAGVYAGVLFAWTVERGLARFRAGEEPRRDERHYLVEQNEEQARLIRELEEKLRATDDQLASAYKSLADRKSELEALRQAKEQLVRGLEQAGEEPSAKETTYPPPNMVASEEVQRLQAELQQRNRECEKLAQRDEDQRTQLKSLRKTEDTLRNQAERSEKRITELQRQVTKKKTALAQAEQRFQLAQQEAEKQLEEARLSAEACEELRQQNETLESQLAELTEAYRTLQDEYAMLERDAVAAAEADERQIAELKARLAELLAERPRTEHARSNL